MIYPNYSEVCFQKHEEFEEEEEEEERERERERLRSLNVSVTRNKLSNTKCFFFFLVAP